MQQISSPIYNPVGQAQAILRLLARNCFEPRERRRLGRELEYLYSRMEQREYRHHSFVRNKFNVPERMQDFLSELDFYAALGRKWSALIQKVNLPPCARVLDLCPGLAPKVELGLYYAGFSGEVIACDRNRFQLNSLRRFLALFQVPFQVRYRHADLFGLRERKFDAVMGNHILDDLLLARAARRVRVPLRAMYEREGILDRLCRDALAHEEEDCEALACRLLCTAGALLKPHGVLMLTHYPSYIERVMRLQEFGGLVRRLMLRIRRSAGTAGLHALRLKKGATAPRDEFQPGQALILVKSTENDEGADYGSTGARGTASTIGFGNRLGAGAEGERGAD